jgi:hypothetical protein
LEEAAVSLWRNNGLSIVLTIITLLLLVGMFFTGWQVYNEELVEHSNQAIGAFQYLGSGHFLSTMFENWESEFLEKAAYVVFTAFLIQRGSAESKDPDKPQDSDEDPKDAASAPDAPWPVRRGGFVLWLYSYSLGITLVLIFLGTIFLHSTFSWEKVNAEAALHAQPGVGYWEHLVGAQFWFESLQNWQSEFMSTGALVVLSIFLRFRGSPESKRVAASNSETGK